MRISKLPDNWEWKKLEELSINPKIDIVDGPFGSNMKATEYVDSGVPIIRLQNIDRNYFLNKNIRFITPEKAERLKRHSFNKGDIVITKLGDPLGKACMVPNYLGNGIIVADVVRARVDPNKVNKQYLVHAINSQQVVEQLEPLVKGSTRPRVNLGHIRELLIPLAPLSEQERIVNRIEELFSDLEAGVVALERARAGLKRYKASVLKSACEGKLFGDRGMESSDELPEGWRWASVAELAAKEKNSITDGPFGSKLKTEHYKETGPRVIRLQNIGDGEFRNEKAHISQDHFETLRKHQIFAGDLVIAGLGESLPRACIIPNYLGDAIVKADCIRFKPNPELADNRYLLYALNSETVKKMSAKIVHGIGRPRMNQQEIKAIPIPLPPLDEQRRIVAEVERRLSVVAEVESAVEAGLVRAGRLRQAILRSAFDGRL